LTFDLHKPTNKQTHFNFFRNTLPSAEGMTIKGQKVESGIFVLYFSANMGFLEHNVLKTFVANGVGYSTMENIFQVNFLF
jgi:hypothetical protein